MIEFQSSERFDQWLVSLSDIKGKARILARLRSASFGHFGDVSHVGAGVYEIRIHFGPGYRVYYKRVGREVYFLLGEATNPARSGIFLLRSAWQVLWARIRRIGNDRLSLQAFRFFGPSR